MLTEMLKDLDITCHGSLVAFLDHIDANGIKPEDGRAFSVWLYERFAEHDATRAELKEAQTIRDEIKADFEAYCDENPAQAPVGEPEVAAEGLYLPNQAVANTRAARLAQDPRVRETLVQFEPDNGWVVVLFPNFADLRDLAGQAEIRDGIARPPQGKRASQSPHKPVEGATPSSHGGQAPARPSSGVTAKVWAIADQVHSERGLDRAAIMAACEVAGINKATAGTQYSKWKKARGF